MRPRGGHDRGVSLMELVVAILILSIATIGIFRVFDQAAQTTAGNRDRLLAGLVARNVAEELVLDRDVRPTVVELSGRQWSVSFESVVTQGGFEEIAIQVAPDEGGPSAQITTYLPVSAP